MIKPIAKLIVALNGYVKKEQIAAGFSWGILLGLVPAGNFFWIVFFIVSFFFRHHHGSKLFAMFIVKLCIGLLNPLVDAAGWELLHHEALQSAFTAFYNMPLGPLTRFNNTLVAGGLLLGLLLWLPVFFLTRFAVPVYRNHALPRIKNSKLMKAFLKLPLVSALAKAVDAEGRAMSMLR